MANVWIALGTNQGDKQTNLSKALEFIGEIPETSVKAQSDFKEYPAQEASEGQEPFLNGVIRLETELLPLELLHKLQVIERKMGRSSKGDGAPRTIDLDVVSYDQDVVFEGKTLTVPHPRLHERLFVLEPLAQIDPDWKHPKFGKTAQELLRELNEDSQNHTPAQS